MRAIPQDDLAPVTRLYERLAEALQRTRRDPFNVAVTVAEIYQELVPYRLVRAEIGFDMNADYEHALLRLLAGEGQYVRIDPPQAAEAIRRELLNPNPNLSVYREHAGCDVWVREPLPSSGPRSPEPTPAAGAAPRPPRQAVAEPAANARGAAARPLVVQQGASTASPKPPALPLLPDPVQERATPRSEPKPPARMSEPAVHERKSRPEKEPPLRAVPERTAAERTASRPEKGPPVRASEHAVPERTPGRKEKESARPRQTDERVPDLVAGWPVPADLKDLLVPPGSPESLEFETLTLADDARPDDGEGNDDERTAPMSEAPKREAAPAGEGAGTQAKTPRSPAATQPAAPSPAAAPVRSTTAAKASTVAAARCAFCDSALPQQRQARFCPYCGADQTTRPCGSCGEAVEPGWAFCIMCGATAQ